MMENYVFRRNKEGIYYINLAKTWEKLMVAARVIAAVQIKNPKDVLVSKKLKTIDRFLRRGRSHSHSEMDGIFDFKLILYTPFSNSFTC